MKLFLKTLLATFVITFIFSACSREQLDQSVSTFTANVNAATFVSTRIDSRLDTSITSSNKRQLTITATNGTQEITIAVTDYNETLPTGTYNINNGRALAIYKSGTPDDYAVSGQVVVTSASRSLVNGTINFVTQSGVQVTDGKFSIVIQP